MELAHALTAEGCSRAVILARLNAMPGRPIASVDSLSHGLNRRGLTMAAPPRAVSGRRHPRAPRPRDAAAPCAPIEAMRPPAATGQPAQPPGGTAAGFPPTHPGSPATAPFHATCMFPLWPDNARPPRPPLFCDQPVTMTQDRLAVPVPSPYCADHHARCHEAPGARPSAPQPARRPVRGRLLALAGR